MQHKLLFIILLFTLKAFPQSGNIDNSFGINGKVTTGVGTGRGWANGIAFQPDGKFIVGGTYVSSHGENDFALARYNSNGTLDETFGVGGKAVTDFLTNGNNYNYINSVHVLADGKILVFGTTGAQSFIPKSAIVKYNSDGTTDTSFGTNGKVISNLFPTVTGGYRLAVQPDGKLVITSIRLYDNDPDYYIGVERYLENGEPDESFGTNGQAVTAFGTGRSIPSSIALQPDGKIVITGSYKQSTLTNVACVRFTANGTLDTSFDGDGKVTTTFGTAISSEGMNVFITTEGRIIVAGAVYITDAVNLGLVQYNANGSLDTGFDGDGKALASLGNFQDYSNINFIARQPDGKFLVACRTGDYNLTASDFVLKRFNSDSTADTSFGTGGVTATTFGTGLNEVHEVAITADGALYAVGRSASQEFYANYDFALAKYTLNGILDMTLDGDGKQTTTFEKANDRVKTLLVLPSDKLIAVGTSAYRQANNAYITDIALSKYNSDGSPDTTFGTSGKILSNFNDHRNFVVTAALQADGKILVSNNYWITSNTYEIIRYNADGSLDNQFGTNGKIVPAFRATAILCLPDGKIIAAGDGVNGIIINRYNSNGTADNSFDGDGNALIPFGMYYSEGVSAVLQPDGKIVLSDTILMDAFSAPSFGTIRVNTDGSLDTLFGDNGKILTLIDSVCYPQGTFLQADGKIIVAGKSVTGNSSFSSVRYNANGIIDATYGTNGVSSSILSNDYKQINTVFLQADGKLLAVLTQLNTAPESFDFKISRFNPDSTPDFTFGGNDGVITSFYGGYDEAFSIGLQSDNKIVVAGSTQNGINEDFALARYTNSILGIDNFTTDLSGIAIYPNPVKDLLHISAAEGMELINYTIYNIMGQVIFKSAAKDMNIDTGKLSKGIYTIIITTNRGSVSKKFIRE